MISRKLLLSMPTMYSIKRLGLIRVPVNSAEIYFQGEEPFSAMCMNFLSLRRQSKKRSTAFSKTLPCVGFEPSGSIYMFMYCQIIVFILPFLCRVLGCSYFTFYSLNSFSEGKTLLVGQAIVLSL